MRIENLQQFRKSVQSEYPLVGILSKEALERRDALRLFLGKKKAATLGADAPPNKIIGELQPSLLTTRPLVVVRDAHSLPKPTQQALVAYCKNPASSSCLVLVGESLPATLSKAVDASGLLLAFPAPKPWEKEENLARQLTNKQLPLALAKEVVRRSGGDGMMAAQEVEKLLTYVGERGITKADIEAIVVSDPTESAWQLGDALFQRDGARALTMMQTLFRQGEAFIAILALLRSQFRDACLAAVLPPQELAQALPKLKGRRLEQLVRQARGWGSARCRRALILLYEADLDARNSVADNTLLADRLIARLVQ